VNRVPRRRPNDAPRLSKRRCDRHPEIVRTIVRTDRPASLEVLYQLADDSYLRRRLCGGAILHRPPKTLGGCAIPPSSTPAISTIARAFARVVESSHARRPASEILQGSKRGRDTHWSVRRAPYGPWAARAEVSREDRLSSEDDDAGRGRCVLVISAMAVSLNSGAAVGSEPVRLGRRRPAAAQVAPMLAGR
jgi:hypothetical protein